MIQALNYCTHAIGDLSEWWPRVIPEAREKVREAIYDLRRAEKFILPLDAYLLDASSMRREFFDLLKLPFPTVALEFPFTEPSESEHTGRQILLVRNWGDKVWITPITHRRQYGWRPEGWAISVNPQECISSLEMGELPGFEWATLKNEKSGVSAEDFKGRMIWAIRVVLQFCCTVNCENVSTDPTPAPDRLNKKRIANGKEPFYSFRVLTVPGHAGSGTVLGGTHASPRLHLRRGHLRRLPSGKVVWVRHCMVGNPDKGVVEKIYRVA